MCVLSFPFGRKTANKWITLSGLSDSRYNVLVNCFNLCVLFLCPVLFIRVGLWSLIVAFPRHTHLRFEPNSFIFQHSHISTLTPLSNCFVFGLFV